MKTCAHQNNFYNKRDDVSRLNLDGSKLTFHLLSISDLVNTAVVSIAFQHTSYFEENNRKWYNTLSASIRKKKKKEKRSLSLQFFSWQNTEYANASAHLTSSIFFLFFSQFILRVKFEDVECIKKLNGKVSFCIKRRVLEVLRLVNNSLELVCCIPRIVF